MPKRTTVLIAFFLPLLAHGQEIVTVSGTNCVWHAGDNPQWAAPEFNDAGWSAIAKWPARGRPSSAWIRCHADLSSLAHTAVPALQVSGNAAWQLFLNGNLIGSEGGMRTGFYSENTIHNVVIPRADRLSGSAMIAIHAVYRIASDSRPLLILAGSEQSLREHRASVAYNASSIFIPVAISFVAIGVLGFMLFGLFLNDRTHRELLYLAIVCWLLALLRLDEFFAVEYFSFSCAVYDGIYGLGQMLEIPFVLFMFSIAGRRIPRFYRILLCIAPAYSLELIGGLFLPAAANLRVTSTNFYWFPAFLLTVMVTVNTSFVAFWPWNRISRRLRPVALCCMVWALVDSLWFTFVILGITRLTTQEGARFFTPSTNSLLLLRALATLSVLVALLILLFRDLRRTADERALLAGEMLAAREIQSMLAPAVLETVPGLRVDVAFHPMRDVGGDFYLCRPLADGRQRILVGDVSGKGTAAAMTATLLIGAAERRAADTPAELLSHLNLVLRDSRVGGFATCLCADLAPDGTVTLANAGHLAPYCRGEEIPVVSSLPLGLNEATDAVYEETRFPLAPGDTLTFVSDGVVEARDGMGILFGFDRTRTISNLSAEEIAATAQTFGQQDDITVLTLAFASQEVAHA
jgi:phosphoserine phosphatase RsbU/P